MFFLGLGIVSIVLVLSAVGVVMYVVAVASSGPSLDSLNPKTQGATSTLYDAEGQRLGFIKSAILRTPVADQDIPQVMRNATVAIEDRRFFQHKGVDFEGVVRAAIKNIDSGSTVEGGSTLTMQLIRNLYTGDRQRNFKRKLREARLAEELENEHPGHKGKLWILNKYINNVPYGTSGGQSAVGVQAAARIFFNKPAKELTLPEAALLAGLPQAPTAFNPITNPGGAKVRRDQVLAAMLKQKQISQAQYTDAVAAPLGAEVGKYYRQRTEGYFFDYVQQQLIDEYGAETVRKGGLKVYTTLDRHFQKAARASINPAVAGTDRSSAVVSVDPANGHIRAMATSGHYGQFKYNLAAQGKYAAGSTFKVMVLMTALRKGVDPKTTFYTSKPLNFFDQKTGTKIDVTTYSNTYLGRVNLVTATLKSDNSVYQQLDLDLGPEAVKKTAQDMGITSKLLGIPSEGLGGLKYGVSPLEMANAYATIASHGWRNKVTAITKVCIPKDADESFDCQTKKPERTRVFTDGVTDQAIQILKANIIGGTGTAANIGCPAGGKTGTVDDFTDAWFVGFTPKLATSVWVGHANERRTLGAGAAGGVTAAPIWGQYMKAIKGSYCGDWPKVKDPFKPESFAGQYSKTAAPGSTVGTTYTPAPQSKGTGGSAPKNNDTPAPPVVSTPAPAPVEPQPGSGGVGATP
jgi:penicillin-binding protein 1A